VGQVTKREAAIVTVYTGKFLGTFKDLYAYAEEKMGRPVYTAEFSSPEFKAELQAMAKADFVALKVEG
jgi:hypothetical protein